MTARLAFPHRRRDLFIGIDAAAHRHLYVEIPNTEEELTERASRGISVSTRMLNVGDGQLMRFVDVECLEPYGHAALDLVASELADALDAGATIERTSLVRNILAKWRRFWSGAGGGLLSREEQIGLFGEMWFMLLWLMPAVGEEAAVKCWRGPWGSRHDFEAMGVAVEVKSTCSSDGLHIVNGVEQLLAPQSGDLYFLSLKLREEQSSTHHLPSLVARARELLQSHYEARSALDSTLESAGYLDAFEREYAKLRMQVRSERLYHVVEGFPRVVPTLFAAGVPNGVTQISYRVSVDVAPHLAVASEPVAARPYLSAMR